MIKSNAFEIIENDNMFFREIIWNVYDVVGCYIEYVFFGNLFTKFLNINTKKKKTELEKKQAKIVK